MKQKLQNLLADGKTGKVIRHLRALMPSLDEELKEEILMQSSRFEALNKDRRNGILSHDQETIQLAKINAALLSIIDRLPGEVSSPALHKRRVVKWGGIVVTAITLLAAIAEFSGYSLRDIFIKEKEPVIQETSPPQEPNRKETTPLPTNSDDLNIQAESIQQKTEGDQSPAVIGKDVSINYGKDSGLGSEEEKQDTTPRPTNSDNLNIQTKSIQQKTEGDQSPAVIGKDVKINYSGDWGLDGKEEKQDTSKKQ